MRVRFALWGGAVFLVAAGLAPQVQASVSLRNLRVGQGPSAQPPMTRFPSNTAGLTVHFDYLDATNERVAVVVTGLGGIAVFQSEQRLVGTGSTDLSVTGPQIYGRLAQSILDSATQARDNVRQAKAASEESVANGYLDGAYLGLFRDKLAADMLLAAHPPEAHRQWLSDIRGLATKGLDLTVRAKQNSSLVGKRSLIDDLATALESLIATGTPLQARSAEATAAIIPPTGSRDEDSYVVQLQIGGVPGATAEFWVQREIRVVLPYLAKNRSLR